MKAFNPLCRVWYQQVKNFFHQLHGHQSKTFALFVLGAIEAERIVIPKVAEAFLVGQSAISLLKGRKSDNLLLMYRTRRGKQAGITWEHDRNKRFVP